MHFARKVHRSQVSARAIRITGIVATRALLGNEPVQVQGKLDHQDVPKGQCN